MSREPLPPGQRTDTRPEVDAPDDAFRAHVVPELPVLLRVAGRLTRDPTAAEDLVQETVLRAYRGIDRFDGRYPRAWLLTIMRNTWRNMNRRVRPRMVRGDDVMAGLVADGAEGRAAEDRVVDELVDGDLARALRTLPRAQLAVVRLVDVDGLTYAEAARFLGVPTGTVMSRLHRARVRLRRRLSQA